MDYFIKELNENTNSLDMFYSYAYDKNCKIGMRKAGKDILIDGVAVMISGTAYTKDNELIRSVSEMDSMLNQMNVIVNVTGQCIIMGRIVKIEIGSYLVSDYSLVDKSVYLKRF